MSDFCVCLLGQKEDEPASRLATGPAAWEARSAERGPGPEAWGRGAVEALTLLFLGALPGFSCQESQKTHDRFSMFCSFYTDGKITQ